MKSITLHTVSMLTSLFQHIMGTKYFSSDLTKKMVFQVKEHKLMYVYVMSVLKTNRVTKSKEAFTKLLILIVKLLSQNFSCSQIPDNELQMAVII